MSNRQLEERWEREADEQAAKAVGLSYEEYQEAGAYIEEGGSDNGFATMIVFPNELDPEIQAKISGLQGDRVYLPPGALATEDDEHE